VICEAKKKNRLDDDGRSCGLTTDEPNDDIGNARDGSSTFRKTRRGEQGAEKK
jgi:hypothetical protein